MFYHWPDNLSFCNTQEQPRHISSAAACSSAGASASATSSETGAWQCRHAIKCQVELVAIPSTHTTLKAFISASLGEYSHVFTKQNQELTELRQDMINFILKIMQASRVGGERKGIDIFETLVAASSEATSASSVGGASASLAWGLWSPTELLCVCVFFLWWQTPGVPTANFFPTIGHFCEKWWGTSLATFRKFLTYNHSLVPHFLGKT